jgi:hypothetical protein
VKGKLFGIALKLGQYLREEGQAHRLGRLQFGGTETAGQTAYIGHFDMNAVKMHLTSFMRETNPEIGFGF